MINIPELAEQWYRHGNDKVDYADLVIVAQAHSYFGTERQNSAPNLVELPAFRKLSLSKMGPDASLEVLFEAEQEIRDIMSMLG